MLWLVLALFTAVLVFWTVIKPMNYWKRRNIPYSKPWPIVGNMASVLFRTKSLLEVHEDLYNDFPDKRFSGIFQFTKPILMIKDIDLIKQITIKDFDYFSDHNAFIPEDVDPLMGKNLFSLKGQRWRDMRATLSPTFTGSKMRFMFILISECAENFVNYFLNNDAGTSSIEMKDIFTRFTNDVIATAAFGLKCDSLTERNNEFYVMGKEATNFNGAKSLIFFGYSCWPSLMKFLRIEFFSSTISNFFRRIVRETIEMREREGLIRPDMIHLLMEARKGRLTHDNHITDSNSGFSTVEEADLGKNDKHQKQELTDDDIVAQALVFFFGGFDPTATLSSLIAYEVALNPDVQKTLQGEIDTTLYRCKQKLTYDALFQMNYLDMVVSEALRKWPLGFQLDRLCVKDYTIPAITKEDETFTIEKGTTLVIPVYAIHRDPVYFPNPTVFDPERFNNQNKAKIAPFSYMPFGIGPRNCIASRFALMEVKTVIVHLLAKFDVVVVEKTSIPLKLAKNNFNLAAEGGVWLGLNKRKIVAGQ